MDAGVYCDDARTNLGLNQRTTNQTNTSPRLTLQKLNPAQSIAVETESPHHPIQQLLVFLNQ